MERKREYKFLFTIFALLFTTSIFANQQTDLESYFDFDNATPSRYCSFSIKAYFQDCYYQTRYTHKSKTAIFNESLVSYVKEVYNSRNYPQLISQNGRHVVEFLELSNELNLDVQSLYTCIRLFHNKIKECELIDDTVMIQILKPLSALIGNYFEPEEELSIFNKNTMSEEIEKILTFKITDHFQDFKERPIEFLKELALEINEYTQKEFNKYKKTTTKEISLERLRFMLIRFLENALNKIIWDASFYEGIWESVITIANDLQVLGNYFIIDHMDDLDDLLWSLTQRFCYFLDLYGSSLPLSFYEEIEYDLRNKVVDFLEAEELDDGIKSKKSFLTYALMKAKAKSYAFEKKGLFTDQMI